jgi:hypothetical protein
MGKVLSYVKYVPHVALILVLIAGWHVWSNKQDYARLFVTPPPPEVIKEIITRTEVAECKPVVHYIKEEAEKKDLVPEYAKSDDDKQVTAAIEVPPHKAETMVTSVMDLSSGINTLSYKQRPVSFFGTGYKEIGLLYGIDEKLIVNARWEALRLGDYFLKLEGSAIIDSGSEFIIGAGVLRRWQ